ncbi:MAG: MoaD/ThiS family protein [Deltaproteobacteria bacterium]|nr:MoaD/ThiS family protein [Deltaproteobacteria bacterium]
MKIELKLYASLASHMPEKTSGNPWIVEVRKGITIREFLEHLKVPTDAVKIMFLNGVHAKDNEILNERDRLGLFPSIAGG